MTYGHVFFLPGRRRNRGHHAPRENYGEAKAFPHVAQKSKSKNLTGLAFEGSMSSDTLLRGSMIPQTTPPSKDVAAGLSQRLPPFQGRAGGTADTAILIAVFLVALFPNAVSAVLMYPDEPQYLDAGVLMCQTKDYLMPACPNDAAPEDMKPILAYWIIAVSFEFFGTSLASARLPFLLAGAAVIWLTHRLALMLTASATSREGSRSAATLSCVVLMCNPIFWLSAVRCIPDIWLCLFLLVSAYGFIGLLAHDAPTSKHALMAYLGVSLAVLTKGVPALIFLGHVVLFGCCNPWRPGSWRRLIHAPSMALGLVLAVGWFVIVVFTRGTDNLELLWSDQVATRVQRDPWTVICRFPVALGALVLAYLPLYWPLWKMGNRWRNVLPASGRQRVASWFIVLWAALNVLAMSGTVDWYVRYLLPAIPLLAVLLGFALAKVDNDVLTHCFRRFLAVTMGLMAVVFLGLLAIGAQLGLTALEIATGVALVAGVVLVGVAGFRGPWLRSAQAIAVIGLFLMPMAFPILRKIARPDLESQIEQRLRLDNLDSRRVAGFIGQKGTASMLRLGLAPQVNLLQWETWPTPSHDSRFLDPKLLSVLILPEESTALLPAEKYSIHPAGSVFGAPQSDDELLQAICQGRLQDCLLQHRIRYSIAVRLDNAQTCAEASRPNQ
jgi:4-amino-4-deoxy-L-arabinose transferase-like glycosyltransferase